LKMKKNELNEGYAVHIAGAILKGNACYHRSRRSGMAREPLHCVIVIDNAQKKGK
jgi:hypothetical protein